MEPFGSTGASNLSRGNNGGSSFSKNKWGSIGQISSSAQVLFGVLLFFCSTLYLMQTGKFSGQLIGALSVVLGLVGIIGLRCKQASLQVLFIVGMGFMSMMTFEFTVQVGRDIELHCMLAESYNRIDHLESRMVSMKHDELVTQLFTRLNEMDDMLDMVQDGAIDKLTTQWTKESLMEQDSEFITSKVQALKSHADKIMDQLLVETNKVAEKEKESTDPKLIRKQKEIQGSLMNRLEQVEKVLDTIEEKEGKNHALSYEEFEELFHAIAGVHSNPESLTADKKELPILKGAMNRVETGSYTQGPDGDRAKALDKHREEQRTLFENTFHKTLSEHRGTDPADFHKSLIEAMEDLPEHCLTETERYEYFLVAGWVLIVSQMAAAYVSATSLIVSNIKKEF